ncbi:LCP family protein [Actinomadura kijaniata]|uniref:LCP family protein n=1 Tax=Actinomadura kijaniata TaxID=46161 RepID=UPI000835AA1E|nr:LCP family protein [Actinomadura kijaniata]
MDDLNALRALGDDLGHEPPPALARQRQRLLDAASGGARRRAARWRPGGWAVIGVAAAVTAALILVPTVLLRGGDDTPTTSHRALGGTGAAMNLLVIGSDERVSTRRFTSEPPRSDTLALVRVSADRRQVQMVALPRDLMVPMSCHGDQGEPVKAVFAQLNAAFTLGGAACSAKTVESLSGVRIDHTVTVGFAGFERMVDALGSVEIVLPKPVDDPLSGLRLPAGRHRVEGRVALAYVRMRYGLTDGSDLERIKRQQVFLTSMAKEAKAARTGNPVGFARFVKAVAESVEIRPGLDRGTLEALAATVDPDGISYLALPVRPYRLDPNRLELRQPAARELFAQLR